MDDSAEPGMRVFYAARLADAAAEAAAEAERAADRLGVHCVTVDPAGRWKVADVDQLCAPARFAGDAAVCVGVGLDDAAPAVWDRLLRVVEEPPTPWWLWVAVTDPSKLPPPLAARAAQFHHAAPTDAAGALVAAGWDPTDAARFVELVGAATHLAPAEVADPPAVLATLEALAAAVDTEFTEAAVTAVDELCKSPGGAPTAAVVLRWCIARHRDNVAARARAAALAGDATGHLAAVAEFDAAERAERAVARNVTTRSVLWALWG